jgi:hypothetical protein
LSGCPRQAAAWVARPDLRRATRAAAPAPNNRIIGGAGTWCPPEDEVEPPLELDELEEREEELLDDEPVLLVLVLPPKLDELLVAPPLDEELPLDELEELDEEEELPEELPELPLDPCPPLEPCPPLDP